MLAQLPLRLLLPVLVIPAAGAQEAQKDYTDPVALLKAIARTYASGADTFHMESIAEITWNADLHHEWRKVYRTTIKGPGNLYRIETRSPFGSFIQDSDGTDEWIYLVEANRYEKHPVPRDWPQFSRLIFAGSNELMDAWSMRTILEELAASYKSATMFPQETITVEGHSYPCYVIHVTSNDSKAVVDKDAYAETTLWIDKTALVFRKQVRHANSYMLATPTIRIRFLEDSTTVYPVADFNAPTTPDMFRFTPPADAKEVAKLADLDVPPRSTPKATMAGQPAPHVSFDAPDGRKIELSSYRGKPLLLDFWATWCGPCLTSMPALNRIYLDVRDKGMAVVTFDEDNAGEDAAEYLARHNYAWTNYHDAGGRAASAFKREGIPLTVLIDAQGKIVYFDSGGDEAAVRKAIAALGPEFAAIAGPPRTRE